MGDESELSSFLGSASDICLEPEILLNDHLDDPVYWTQALESWYMAGDLDIKKLIDYPACFKRDIFM